MATPRTPTSGVTTTASAACTTPAGAAVGDTLVVHLTADTNETSFTAPVGWTEHMDFAQNTGASQAMGGAVFSHVLVGAPSASYTFTGSNAGIGWVMSCVDAEGGTSPTITSSGNPTQSTLATYTTASLANSANDRVLFAGFWADTDFTVSTPPSGMTLEARRVDNATSVVAVYSEVNPSGTPLTRSITWSGADENIGHLLLVSYSAGGTAYTLTADSGTFALTGADAALLMGRKLSAESGTFTLAGTDAGLLAGRRVSAESGSFTLTGTAASLLAGYRLSAESGSFTLTGQDVTLTYDSGGSPQHYTLTAEPGAFTLAGTDAGVLAGRLLPAASGSFTLAGTDAALTAARKLTAESGSFTVTGASVTLTWSGAEVVVTVTPPTNTRFAATVTRTAVGPTRTGTTYGPTVTRTSHT